MREIGKKERKKGGEVKGELLCGDDAGQARLDDGNVNSNVNINANININSNFNIAFGDKRERFEFC